MWRCARTSPSSSCSCRQQTSQAMSWRAMWILASPEATCWRKQFPLLASEINSPHLQVVLKLGIGKCKLCLQAPVQLCDARPIQAFVGKRIVTSFPSLTKRFFDGLSQENHSTHIKEVSGSVEAACGLGLADAVVDLVETGTTMKAAGAAVDETADLRQLAAVDGSGLFWAAKHPKMPGKALLFQQRPTEANGLETGTKADMLQLIEKRIAGYLTATKYVMIICNCHHETWLAVVSCLAMSCAQKTWVLTGDRIDFWEVTYHSSSHPSKKT
ncbi:ATP phosphoribosyltransferase (ATP-PRT) (ATP-PRTase) [Durusdinium trenchii]|uniref:ATP phosphoribosyltransferase n=1 Tax=Durusdinium trenchii TaxID=1381693 RepID=A0ABP0RH80_9DINO